MGSKRNRGKRNTERDRQKGGIGVETNEIKRPNGKLLLKVLGKGKRTVSQLVAGV